MYSDSTDIVYEISASSKSRHACNCHPPSSIGTRQWWSRAHTRHWVQFDTCMEDDRVPQGCRFYIQCRQSHEAVVGVVRIVYKSRSRWRRMCEPVECKIRPFVTQIHALTSCKKTRARVMRIVVELSYPCSVTITQCEWLHSLGSKPRSYPPFPYMVDGATELVDSDIAASHSSGFHGRLL